MTGELTAFPWGSGSGAGFAGGPGRPTLGSMPARARRGPRIQVTCPACAQQTGTVVRAGWTRCGHCRAKFYVPARAAGRAEQTWTGAAGITCRECGHRFRSRARPGGRTHCPACDARLPVPDDPGRWYANVA